MLRFPSSWSFTISANSTSTAFTISANSTSTYTSSVSSALPALTFTALTTFTSAQSVWDLQSLPQPNEPQVPGWWRPPPQNKGSLRSERPHLVRPVHF